jgi:hypothetical protein
MRGMTAPVPWPTLIAERAIGRCLQGGSIMMRFTGIARRIVIALVVLTLTLGAHLLQPAGTLAGFGSSPGFSACCRGEHVKEVKLTVR